MTNQIGFYEVGDHVYRAVGSCMSADLTAACTIYPESMTRHAKTILRTALRDGVIKGSNGENYHMAWLLLQSAYPGFTGSVYNNDYEMWLRVQTTGSDATEDLAAELRTHMLLFGVDERDLAVTSGRCTYQQGRFYTRTPSNNLVTMSVRHGYRTPINKVPPRETYYEICKPYLATPRSDMKIAEYLGCINNGLPITIDIKASS